VSIIEVDPKRFDTGAILAQETVSLVGERTPGGDRHHRATYSGQQAYYPPTYSALSTELADRGARMLVDCIEDLSGCRARAVQQQQQQQQDPPLPAVQYLKAPKLHKDAGQVRWEDTPASTVHNWWRGLHGNVGTFTFMARPQVSKKKKKMKKGQRATFETTEEESLATLLQRPTTEEPLATKEEPTTPSADLQRLQRVILHSIQPTAAPLPDAIQRAVRSHFGDEDGSGKEDGPKALPSIRPGSVVFDPSLSDTTTGLLHVACAPCVGAQGEHASVSWVSVAELQVQGKERYSATSFASGHMLKKGRLVEGFFFSEAPPTEASA
jgi:methionyl-tRNA formyltransferase